MEMGLFSALPHLCENSLYNTQTLWSTDLAKTAVYLITHSQ